MHVTYILYYIHGFTQISSEDCRLRLNIQENSVQILEIHLKYFKISFKIHLVW